MTEHSDDPSDSPAAAGHIELSIPARGELLQLVRITAGVVAGRVDLGLNDVEDLRLAVEELCLSLVGPTGEAAGRLVLRYGWDHESIDVTCTLVTEGEPHDLGSAARRAAGDGLPADLSSQILDALVDDHGETEADGQRRAWLRMDLSSRVES